MSATVLVVEYEPRYLDRLRHAFAGRPLSAVYARDGAEALQALQAGRPDVIVLSWILPKTSTADLIRAIHASESGADVPILLTVSGYNGRDSRADARRVGATDLLPKPFTESDLMGRLAELAGIDPQAMHRVEHELGDFSIDLPPVRPPEAMHAAAAEQGGKLTADEIFSGVLDEDAPAAPAPAEAAPDDASHVPKKTAEEDLDELLNQTLISLKKKKKVEPRRDGTASSELDRLVEDTLSGLPRRKKVADAPAAEEPLAAVGPEDFDRVPFSSPIVPLEPPGEETLNAKPGARIGQFVLRERIATGGMAEIWKARREGVEGFEKFVAIKRILPHLAADQEFVDMFINEAKIAARLNHPNIIHIYDLGRAAGTYYIAMELVDGHDLKTALRQAGERDHPISLELAVFIASKVATALDFAHRKEEGLVHRDVSPQNVLISWEGDIKLCDFGIAKATSKVSHTQSGALKGKIQYMSPEQASGKAIDRRSDVFSLGVVLFEMLTGKKLFQGDSEISVLDQVRDARAVVPSQINDEVPAEIDAVVLKALAKDPEQRFTSAGEMARELDKVLYAFRPTPGAADLAVWMHQLWRDETAAVPAAAPEPAAHSREEEEPISIVASTPPRHVGNEPVLTPPARPAPRTLAAHPPPSRAAAKAAPPSRRRVGWILVAVIAVAAVGGVGAWMALRPGPVPESPAAPVATASLSPSISPQRASMEPVDLSAAPELIPTDPAPVADTAPSAELVAQEVERRLQSERERLERLRRQEEAARQRAAEAPRPAATPPRESASPPSRAAVERDPAPAPAQRSPAPPLEEAATPPPTAAEVTAVTETAAAQPVPVRSAPASSPAEPPVRRGDLVQPGTPGLVEPQLVSLRRVTYPPMAKVRRIEGIVVIRVLISETGEVLEADLLRGVTPDVGIDQAAMEAVRGGSFRPATKDGVAVKAYKTVTVPFRL